MKKTTLLMLLIACGYAAIAQIPSYIPTAGLLAWYPFTGNPNDSGGYANHGSPIGTVNYGTDRFGVANSSFRPDSMSAVDFPTHMFPLGNAARTVSIFFKLSDPLGTGIKSLFSWGNNSVAGGRFGLMMRDSMLGWESVGSAVLFRFDRDTFWHQLAVSYAAAGVGSPSIKVYLDGRLQTMTTTIMPLGSLNTTTGYIHWAGTLYIGPSFLYGWHGRLDDIAVWDHELTPCEIEKMYHGPVPLTPVITAAGSVLSTTIPFSGYQWIKNGTSIPGATNSFYAMTGGGIYRVAVVTAGGCLDTSLVYTTTLNTPYSTLADVIKIYPNPSKNIFDIDSPVPLSAVIIDIVGKVVKNEPHITRLDLNGLPQGAYLVSFYDENGIHQKTERIHWAGN